AGVTSQTSSFTVGSGANRVLWAGIESSAGDLVTSVTYAGNAMTQIAQVKDAAGGTAYPYLAIATTSGTNNIVVTASASTNLSTAAASYTGAKQTGQPETSGTNSAGSANNVSM